MVEASVRDGDFELSDADVDDLARVQDYLSAVEKLEASLVFNPELTAPIQQGDVVGKVELYLAVTGEPFHFAQCVASCFTCVPLSEVILDRILAHFC